MFKSFWGFQDQQAERRPQEVPSNSWSPPSSTGNTSIQRLGDRAHSSSYVYPTDADDIIVYLKDKSVDELRKLLADKEAYHQILLSFDLVRTQNNVRDELQKETLQLARENLEKELRMTELRNQCQIIRTTELATAQEKLNDLIRQKEEILKFYSPSSLVQRLEESMNETEEESDMLHKRLIEKEMDLSAFVQKYKKVRMTYHRRALTHLAAKMSLTG